MFSSQSKCDSYWTTAHLKQKVQQSYIWLNCKKEAFQFDLPWLQFWKYMKRTWIHGIFCSPLIKFEGLKMLLSTAPLLIEYCSDMLMLIKELVISSNAAKN